MAPAGAFLIWLLCLWPLRRFAACEILRGVAGKRLTYKLLLSEYAWRKRRKAKANREADGQGTVRALHPRSEEAKRGRKREGFRGSNASVPQAEGQAERWEQLGIAEFM